MAMKIMSFHSHMSILSTEIGSVFFACDANVFPLHQERGVGNERLELSRALRPYLLQRYAATITALMPQNLKERNLSVLKLSSRHFHSPQL